MSDTTRRKALQISLAAFGAVFLFIYPLGMVWPSGWIWHGGEGSYYLQMIAGVYFVLGLFLMAAARNPEKHHSLISFTVWSSVVHAGIMAIQAIGDHHETGHLMGDVPALVLVAVVLGLLTPREREIGAAAAHDS
ncbi:MAG: DUF6632 domain-containing protein [Acidobacteriota bacterium]